MGIKLYGNTSRRKSGYAREPEEKRYTAHSEPGVKKKKTWKKVVIIFAAILALCVTAFAIVHSLVVKAPTLKNDGSKISVISGSRKNDFFTFLLCGTDVGDLRTDTIMVASYDIANKKISIVSVPRDTLINVTWNAKKINSAYQIDGVEGLKNELKAVLGFDIDYYAVVNLKAFKEIVDAIGGVKFNVPEDMYYEDPDQDLLIDLEAGEQVLNGEKAMELIRYRSYAQADIKRISVQQAFLKAVFSQTLKIGNITKINELANIFSKNMKTDLATGNLIWLGEKMLSVKTDDITTVTLQGSGGSYNGISYWLLDASKVLEVVNKHLTPLKKSVALSDLDIVTIKDGYIVSQTGKKVRDTRRSSEFGDAGTSPTPGVSPSPTPNPSASPNPSANPSASPKPSGSLKPSPSPATTNKPSPNPAPSPSPKPAPLPTVKP